MKQILSCEHRIFPMTNLVGSLLIHGGYFFYINRHNGGLWFLRGKINNIFKWLTVAEIARGKARVYLIMGK